MNSHLEEEDKKNLNELLTLLQETGRESEYLKDILKKALAKLIALYNSDCIELKDDKYEKACYAFFRNLEELDKAAGELFGYIGNGKPLCRCPNCHRLLVMDSSFCPNCGIKSDPSDMEYVMFSTIPDSWDACCSCSVPMDQPPEPTIFQTESPGVEMKSESPEVETKPESPGVEMKEVEFSALAPKTFVKDDYTMIHVVMYEEAFRHVVDELRQEMDGPSQEARSGIHRVKEGAEIRVFLSSPSPGIEIDDNESTQIWQGKYLNFSFGVFVPQEYKMRKALFSATVYVNDVIATKLNFVAKCSSFFEQKITVTREDVLSAFVSYASQDRGRVAAIIQGMKKARPDLDVFFDVENLRSGENWQEALYREIERRDILFLCWSHFARDSKWVDAEWRYAYTQKGAECVEPIPIEPPNLCPPPEELSSKHFNDRLLHYMEEER